MKGLERYEVKVPHVPITLTCGLRGMRFQMLTISLLLKHVGLQSYGVLITYREYSALNKQKGQEHYNVIELYGYMGFGQKTVVYEN